MNELEVKEKIKNFLVSELNLDDDLAFDAELFGDEVALDSIDSVEIVSFIDSEFGVSMTGVAKENFQSINTLAAYVVSHLE